MCTCYGNVIKVQTGKETLSTPPPPSSAPVRYVYTARAGSRPWCVVSFTADCEHSNALISTDTSTTGRDLCLILPLNVP